MPAMTAKPTALGRLLEAARKGRPRAELTFELSKKIGERVDQSWLARVETGETKQPARNRIEAMAEILGLDKDTVLALLDDEGSSQDAAGLPAAIVGTLAAWEPWELELLASELTGIRERYRSTWEMIKCLQPEPATIKDATATAILERPTVKKPNTRSGE